MGLALGFRVVGLNVGLRVVGLEVVGLLIVGLFVMGSLVVGSFVVGSLVMGSSVVGAMVVVGAALIKKYSSYRTYPKKVPRVFFPKPVWGDLKSPPDRWQTLLPSSTILSISFSSNIAQYPPPLELNG